MPEDEISEEELAKEEQARQDRLNALGDMLSKSRSDCIQARESTGIEAEWLEDEEYYEGIDDANRGEMRTWQSKPPNQADITTNKPTASTIFPNITRPYTDTASAKLADMLNPSDDRAWEIEPTPIPEMVQMARGEMPRSIAKQIGEQIEGQDAAQAEQQRMMDEAKNEVADATEKADRAQIRIDDWHRETSYHAENRKVIKDAVKIGSGILKGPIPQKKTHLAYVNGEMVKHEEIVPGSHRVSYWNCYPDVGVGDDIQNGSCHWERDDISSKALYQLRGMRDSQGDPIYIDEQITALLEEGPHSATKEFNPDKEMGGLVQRDTKNLFEIWYYYGDVKAQDLKDCGCKIPEGEENAVMYFVQLEMINNRVIKAALDPLEGTEFPYDYMIYQERDGMPWGIGVPRQIRPAQNMIKGAVRNMMDNAGLAGGPMWVYFPGIITPLNGVAELRPRKGWVAGEDANPSDIKDAFHYIEMDMMQPELEAIIMLGLRFAETITGLPMMLQGQTGSGPETLGGQQMANNNASTTQRSVARNFDDRITIPHLRRYYSYLLIHGDDEEKGDYSIIARGSSVLVERDIQAQTIIQLGSMVVNPVFGIDPRKWAQELLKSWRFDAKNFEYDDDKWEQLVQKLAESANKPDNRLEVENIRGNYRAAEGDKKRAFDAAMKEFDSYLKSQEQSGKRSSDLDKLRASFAELDRKLKVQVMLSGTQVVEPAVEPAGRAPDGQSFTM